MEIGTNYNRNDPEAAAIREKIAYLAAQHAELQIYDVIPIEEVRKFEAAHQIQLPEDYVWFITNVGNGGTWQPFTGAGWSYYFYPLEKAYFSDKADDDETLLFDLESDEKQFSLDILSTGCSYSLGIVLKGEHRGEITHNGDGRAFYNPVAVRGFKELYLKWLDEECRGYDISSFEYRLYGTVEAHLEQYRQQHDLDLLRNIFSKINKQCATPKIISDLYAAFVAETENDRQVMLARILIKAGYQDACAVLKRIFSEENYEAVVWELHASLHYFSKWLDAEGVMKSAGKYYPMLVKAMHYYETAENRKYFKYCLPMTVMNPRFDENDIKGILTSDDPEIVKYLAVSVYQKNIKSRIGKYIEAAKQKYQKNTK